MARVTLEKSVKFKTLVHDLGLPKPCVRGLLETLWDVAHECGNPVLGNERHVELAAEWYGEAGAFFAALRDGGWIDQRDDGKWEIHDYWDHCPDYVHTRATKEAERRKEKACQQCGQFFRSPETHAKFCSHACRQTSYRRSVTQRDAAVTDVTERDAPPAPTRAPAPAPKEEIHSPAVAGAGKKERKKPTGEHHELIAYFSARWERKYHAKYPFTRRDAPAAKEIREYAPDPKQYRPIIDRYLGDPDQFAHKLKHPLYFLGNNLQKWARSQVETPQAIKDDIERQRVQRVTFDADAWWESTRLSDERRAELRKLALAEIPHGTETQIRVWAYRNQRAPPSGGTAA